MSNQDAFDDRQERKAEDKVRAAHLAGKPPRRILRMIDGKLQSPLANKGEVCKDSESR